MEAPLVVSDDVEDSSASTSSTSSASATASYYSLSSNGGGGPKAVSTGVATGSSGMQPESVIAVGGGAGGAFATKADVVGALDPAQMVVRSTANAKCCSPQWFLSDVMLSFPDQGYEDKFLTYYLMKNSRKMTGVTVLCTLLSAVAAGIAVVFESQRYNAPPGTEDVADDIAQRVGLYGGLFCYIFGAVTSRVDWFQNRWPGVSIFLMVVFATCRLSSAYLAQYGVDDRLCDVVANFTPGHVEKVINLTQGIELFAGGYQKGQADSGLAFLPMWLVFFGPVYKHLFVVCLLLGLTNVIVFPVTGCVGLIGQTAYAVMMAWIIMCYVVLLFLFWAWEWHMRKSYHLENVLALENVDLGHVANPFSADSLKDWIRQKQLSIAQRPSFSTDSGRTSRTNTGSAHHRPKKLSLHRHVAPGSGSTKSQSAAGVSGGVPAEEYGTMHPVARSHPYPSSGPKSSHNKASRTMRGPTQPWDLDYKQLRVLRKIAAGSGGLVYEAEYRGERVAVKESLSQLFKLEEVGELSREISMLYKARHPNIVQFLGLCYQKERRSIAIVVEWCPKTLRAWLDAVQPSKETRIHVLDKAHEIAVGMRYLHEDCQIVHRDLKPANVLIGMKGMAKICDFGLATSLHTAQNDQALIDNGTDDAANTAQVQGTPGYIAPELFNAGDELGLGGSSDDASLKYAVDVYSFGIILFELLTFGKVKPFDLSVFNCAPSKAARLLAESGQRPNLGKVDLNLIPSELLHMAKDCWSAEAWNRPSFSVIVNTIERQLRLLQAHIYSQPPTPDMEGHQ